jgi:hypothetical protein
MRATVMKGAGLAQATNTLTCIGETARRFVRRQPDARQHVRHLKACVFKQSTILVRAQAAMIRWFALQLPDSTSFDGTARKHHAAPGAV